MTSIAIEDNVKKELDNLKVHQREPYNDVIVRLIHDFKQNKLQEKVMIDG